MCCLRGLVNCTDCGFRLQNLKHVAPVEDRVDSVHYLMMPKPIEGASDPNIERAVATMQIVINAGRKIREQQKKSMKQPLKELTVRGHARRSEACARGQVPHVIVVAVRRWCQPTRSNLLT